MSSDNSAGVDSGQVEQVEKSEVSFDNNAKQDEV